MGRTLAALVLVLVLTASLIPAGAAADPGVDTLDIAWADWAVPTDDPDRFKWYFGIYFKWATAGERGKPFVTIGRGICIRKRSPKQVSIQCGGRRASIKNKEWAYSSDPILSEARLRVRQDGRHVIHWIARDPVPSTFTAQGACQTGVAQGGGLFRDTRAVGRLYGKRFAPRHWFDFSFLMSGALASTCTGYVDIAERLQAGRRITITRSF